MYELILTKYAKPNGWECDEKQNVSIVSSVSE